MTHPADEQRAQGEVPELPLEEHLQPPMANGEVLFNEPWQGRVFGMAVALHEAGVFNWSEFQSALINAIGDWERTELDGDDPAQYHYYVHFQTALQHVLDSCGVLADGELDVRAREFAARPHGHDHDHQH